MEKVDSTNFTEKACYLAMQAHNAMMQQGMAGIYTPFIVCGITVTCADDLQSVKNRFCEKLRSVKFDEIDAAIDYFSNHLCFDTKDDSCVIGHCCCFPY